MTKIAGLPFNLAEKIMHRCLDLAVKGKDSVASNPMVGAVLVSKKGEILAEGYHKGIGKEHAEALALKKWDSVPPDSILFVNLEPCCHQGKNPPCTQNIIKKNVKQVVIGMQDPHYKVLGKGIKILQENNIKVHLFLEKECLWFNQKYIINTTKHRPLVIAKIASSLDGKIALANGQSQWITAEPAREKAHWLRNSVDALVIGKKYFIAR